MTTSASTNLRIHAAWVHAPECERPADPRFCWQEFDSLQQLQKVAEQNLDLIVLGLQTLDQYSEERQLWLITQYPLAEIVIVCSDWAAGLPRSRKTWPLPWCVPTWRATHRIATAVENVKKRLAPIPPTATYQKGFEQEYEWNSSTACLKGLSVGVLSADLGYAKFLKDWLTSIGIPQTANPDLLLVDVDRMECVSMPHSAGNDSSAKPWIAISGEADWRRTVKTEFALPAVAQWHKLSTLTQWETELAEIAQQFVEAEFVEAD